MSFEEQYRVEDIIHPSDELTFIMQEILKCLTSFRQDTTSSSSKDDLNNSEPESPPDASKNRVLLCGQANDVRCCINALTTAVNGDPSILTRVIVATEDISPFSPEILEPSKPQIVEWNEAVYEEYLVERVKRHYDEFVIGLAIDFCPTIRRVRRIRHLLEKDGTLIIPSEGRGWREAHTDLLSSFVRDGGRFLALADLIPSAARAHREAELFQPIERRHFHQFGPISLRELVHSSGEKCR
ncbi:unnamed protein product [Mesocestoides corti]|uniref:Methyltransf_11 domain-containing protein n=1 Tax=Mesocestoides corti TaxID=53468 RepID=A0A0R3U2U2_MESCO|nr:unnamed protein product [Mesocestoides corti]